MKITRTVLAAALVLLLVITSLACSLLTMPQTEELETKIYHFLKEKYPDLEFEIKGYTQDTYTSGKYVFQVFCKTTEIDFQIYLSSFLMTDSYTVTYANLAMEKTILALFGEELSETQIRSVQWLDLYADGSVGYKFRDVDLSQLPSTVSDIASIHRITLHATDSETVLQALQTVTEKLNAVGCSCDDIAFEWTQNDYTIVFSTNTFTLNHASREELLAFLSYVSKAKQSDEIVTVSYVSRMKYATLRLNEMEKGEKFSVFESQISENRTATAENVQ